MSLEDIFLNLTTAEERVCSAWLFSLLRCRQFQEDVFKTHGDRLKLVQSPAVLDHRTRQIAADVLFQLAFDLESMAAVVAADSMNVDDARHGLQLRRDFRRRPLNLHEDPFGALQLESQILGGIDSHDLAAIDDHNAIAGLLDLGKNVR